MHQGIGEVMAGALAPIAPVAFAAGAVVVRPPRIDVLALAPGTWEEAIVPSQRRDVGLALFGTAERVDI